MIGKEEKERRKEKERGEREGEREGERRAGCFQRLELRYKEIELYTLLIF